MKNKKYLTLPIALLVVIVVCQLIILGVSKDDASTEAPELEEQSQIVEEAIPEKLTTTDTKDIVALQADNADIYAWITIPGTTLDYPVLQSEDDNFYLDHKADGSEGLPGAVYTNKIDGKDFSKSNTVIYGHNMKDGSYFGQLHLFEDEGFFTENKEIYVYLEDKKLTYEIIAASKFNDSYLPEKYLMDSAVGVKQFFSDLSGYASEDSTCHFTEDFAEVEDGQYITLSTCIKGENDQRYVVVGRLVTVEFYE